MSLDLVKERSVPKGTKYVRAAREAQKRQDRNWFIYKNWLKSDDKPLEVKSLAGRWGLSEVRIQSIIDAQAVEVPVIYRAEASAIRERKTIHTLADYDEFRVELTAQIEDLERRREKGEKTVEIEVIEEAGFTGKGPSKSTKTKKVMINPEIRRLKQMMAESHDKEGQALANYIPKPVQQVEVSAHVLHIHANEEFKEMFDNHESQSKVIDAEIIEEKE